MNPTFGSLYLAPQGLCPRRPSQKLQLTSPTAELLKKKYMLIILAISEMSGRMSSCSNHSKSFMISV